VTRDTIYAPGENRARSTLKSSTKFTGKNTQHRRTVSMSCSIHTTENITLMPQVHRADSHLECNLRAEVLGLRNAVESPAFLTPHTDRACRGTFPWCHILTSLLIYLGFSGLLSSSGIFPRVYGNHS
jgi:hypothetical protein